MRLEKRPFCTSFSELVKALKHFPLSDSTKNRSHTNISPCCFGILEERWLSSNLFQATWSDIWPLLNRPTFLTTQVIFVIWELMRETSFHTEKLYERKKFLSYLLSHLSFSIKNHDFSGFIFLKFTFFFCFAKGQFQVQKCSFVREAKNSFIYDNVQGFLNFFKKWEQQKHGQFLKKKVCCQYKFFYLAKM